MRAKIIFVLLFMLSFTLLHDSFFSLIQKNDHVSVVHYIDDQASSQECIEFNKIHAMFHFIAIVVPYSNRQMLFAKKEHIPHHLVQYTPPLVKTSHKPPIA